jgi:hypothetical protein
MILGTVLERGKPSLLPTSYKDHLVCVSTTSGKRSPWPAGEQLAKLLEQLATYPWSGTTA